MPSPAPSGSRRALALVVLLAISAGLRGVARLMQWLVPIMALLWVAASLFVAALHIDQVPA
jgi:AGCS family alanine or glycine:cation symporter